MWWWNEDIIRRGWNGGRFDKNILYACMKFSVKTMEKILNSAVKGTRRSHEDSCFGCVATPTLCGARNRTQGFACAEQALYQLSEQLV